MKKRRLQTIRTLDSMSVLDIAQGLKDKEEEQTAEAEADNDALDYD